MTSVPCNAEARPNKSVAISCDIEWSPQRVEKMSVAMSYDTVTLKEVVGQTSLNSSLPSHTDIAIR
eukprot:9956361-Karenia_brevis.AAC.1